MKRPAAAGHAETPEKEEDAVAASKPCRKAKAKPRAKAKAKATTGKNKGKKDSNGKAKAEGGSGRKRRMPNGEKATFARRVQSLKEPMASFWAALRDAYVATIQERIRKPSTMEAMEGVVGATGRVVNPLHDYLTPKATGTHTHTCPHASPARILFGNIANGAGMMFYQLVIFRSIPPRQ